MNTKSALERVQHIYIGVFTVILVVLATIALCISVASLVWVGFVFLDSPKLVQPARVVSAKTIDAENFVAQAKRESNAPVAKKDAKPGLLTPVSQPQGDPMDVLLDQQVQKLWTYYEGYQQTCKAENLISRSMFDDAFPRVLVKDWLRSWGATFASAQDEFMKTVLSNEAILAICKNSQGRVGIFPSALDWHKNEWEQQIKAVESVNESERRRVAAEERTRATQIQLSRDTGMKILALAAVGFGIFMSIVITLIFAKIELNLRQILKPQNKN